MTVKHVEIDGKAVAESQKSECSSNELQLKGNRKSCQISISVQLLSKTMNKKKKLDANLHIFRCISKTL